MEVGWMFGTKALSDDAVMKTQATVDSKEGNLSVHDKVKFYRLLVPLDFSVPTTPSSQKIKKTSAFD